MNNKELQLLCGAVGRRLSGKPITVRFQAPAWRGADGTAGKRAGVGVVDIKPGLTSDRFLYVLCHEIGHVKSLWHEWQVDVPDYEPESLNYPASFSTTEIVSAIESEADKLAREWLNYADDHAHKYQGDWLETRLKALVHYSEPVFISISEDVITRAVNRGIEKAMQRVRQNFAGG